MGLNILDLGAGGCRRQESGDLLQQCGSGSDPVMIGDVGHDPAHRQNYGGISPLSVLPADEKKSRRDADGTCRYPSLSSTMAEAGLEEVDTYVIRIQNTAVQYIVTCLIMEIFLEAKNHPGKSVSKRWR